MDSENRVHPESHEPGKFHIVYENIFCKCPKNAPQDEFQEILRFLNPVCLKPKCNKKNNFKYFYGGFRYKSSK
jgi:hypothetical protein